VPREFVIKYILTIFLALCALSCGVGRENQFVARQITIGTKVYNYRVYVPKNRLPETKLPVMLYLHGSGSRGDDNLAQVQSLNEYIAQNPERFNFIIVAPQCSEDAFWVGEMSDQALAALDETVQEFNGDDKRLYLTGYSLGGNGVWLTGALNPGKFAALVPIAGWAVPSPALTPHQREPLSPELLALFDAADPYKAFAEKIGRTPVWVFHGDEDNVLPIFDSRKLVEALKAEGNQRVKFTEYENDGHDIVAKPFNDPAFFEWLLKQQRN
jgi:predicted peptidase